MLAKALSISRVGQHESEALADLDLQAVLDQCLDHFLPRRRLARRQHRQPAALLDLVIRDRVAIDEDGNLRRQPAPAAQIAATIIGERREYGTAYDRGQGAGTASRYAYNPPGNPLTPVDTDVPPSVRRLNCSMIRWSAATLPL